MKWQPVMLVINKRLECKCGNLAIFVVGKIVDDEYNSMDEVDVWCQDCWDKAQQEEEE